MYLDGLDKTFKWLMVWAVIGIALSLLGAAMGTIWLAHHIHFVWK